jgi:two-component system sensor histidine kinase BarA
MFKGIKSRVLLLTLVPVALTAFVLSTYFAIFQLQKAEDDLVDRAETLTRYIANASEYGVFARNPELLVPIVESALQEESVVSITITDSDGNELLSQSADNRENTSFINNPNYKNTVFSKPITQSILELDEITKLQQNDTTNPTEVIGHVFVEYSHAGMIERQKAILSNTLLITVLGIVIGIILALHFSEKITTPILRLTHKVQEIESGKFDTNIEIVSPDEIGALEQGIQSMLLSIRGAQQNLQKEVKEATSELEKSLQLVGRQNKELTIARQQALEASRTKSAFLANMSHEIRTPMNGILGFLKLLRESSVSHDQGTYLDIIEKSANNLLLLINDILDISKIEAGKLTLRKKEFDLAQCIEETLSFLAPSAYEKNIEIVSIIYNDTPDIVFGDPDRLRQILLNLVGNAIKFSDQGSIIVRTMHEKVTDNGTIIKLSISDQGIGIPDSDKQKIFNQFSQLDNSLLRNAGGTGLGLAISKSLAGMMEGEIGVLDNPPKGSTFWFTFTTPVAKTIENHFDTEALGTNQKRVILYDANEYTRLSCRHMLDKFEFDIIECDTEDCILRNLNKDETPDLVVYGVSGNDASAKAFHATLSKIKSSRETKVIALTNSMDPASLLKLREWGAYDCLSKPITTKELNRAIERVYSNMAITHKHENITLSNASIGNNLYNNPTLLADTTILLAEDNNINLQLLFEIISNSGATIISSQSGREAIEAFHNQDIDIILMDVHMPEIDGLEATKEIRASENGTRHTPIIGITASLQEDDEGVYLAAGMDTVLLKPIDPEILLDKISKLLDKDKIPLDISKGKTGSPASRPVLTDPHELLKVSLPQVRNDIEAAFRNKDWDNLAELLHKFIGGLSYCGLPQLKQSAEAVYHNLDPNDPEIPNRIASLLREISDIEDKE